MTTFSIGFCYLFASKTQGYPTESLWTAYRKKKVQTLLFPTVSTNSRKISISSKTGSNREKPPRRRRRPWFKTLEWIGQWVPPQRQTTNQQKERKRTARSIDRLDDILVQKNNSIWLINKINRKNYECWHYKICIFAGTSKRHIRIALENWSFCKGLRNSFVVSQQKIRISICLKYKTQIFCFSRTYKDSIWIRPSSLPSHEQGQNPAGMLRTTSSYLDWHGSSQDACDL